MRSNVLSDYEQIQMVLKGFMTQFRIRKLKKYFYCADFNWPSVAAIFDFAIDAFDGACDQILGRVRGGLVINDSYLKNEFWDQLNRRLKRWNFTNGETWLEVDKFIVVAYAIGMLANEENTKNIQNYAQFLHGF